MKTRFLTLSLLTLLVAVAPAAPLDTAFTYQGRLNDGAFPVTGLYDFNFKLYDAETGGTGIGPAAGVTTNAVPVTNGVFSVNLDFGAVFNGDKRWLDMAVNTNAARPLAALTPRQPLQAAPYALFALKAAMSDTATTATSATTATTAGSATTATTATSATTATVANSVAANAVNNAGLQSVAVTATKIADGTVVRSVNGLADALTIAAGANITLGTAGNTLTISGSGPGAPPWLLGGNGGTGATNFLGTTDSQPLELRVNNTRAFRLESTLTAPNVIGGSQSNLVSAGAVGGSIGGGGHGVGGTNAINDRNQVSDNYGTVAGGARNQAGNANSAPGDATYAAVGGGYSNQAQGPQSTIAGGRGNRALGTNATIGGGQINRVSSINGTIGGGYANTNDATASVIAGGEQNFIGTNIYDTGGFFATNFGGTSAVLGGQNNRVSSLYSGVGVGSGNSVYGNYGFIGGGLGNRIGSPGLPSQDLLVGTIGGGSGNQVWGGGATISGGEGNNAGGFWSTVPGGALNTAEGQYSLAAGRRAKANHDGSFVWADSTDANYASTGTNQFRVRASGGAFFEGPLTTKVLTITGGADLAEPFEMSSQDIPKGALVAIDESHPGQLRMTENAYDTRIAGIVSGAKEINPGIILYQQGAMEGSRNVALTGRVYALAEASKAPIKPGDLLTSSDVPGHAMKVTDSSRGTGAIIGKAMTGLKDGKGMVLVLVSLQ